MAALAFFVLIESAFKIVGNSRVKGFVAAFDQVYEIHMKSGLYIVTQIIQ